MNSTTNNTSSSTSDGHMFQESDAAWISLNAYADPFPFVDYRCTTNSTTAARPSSVLDTASNAAVDRWRLRRPCNRRSREHDHKELLDIPFSTRCR